MKSVDDENEGRRQPPPLYAHIVHKYFWHKEGLPETPSLTTILNGAFKWNRVDEQLGRLKLNGGSSINMIRESKSSSSIRKSGSTEKKLPLDGKTISVQDESVTEIQAEIPRKHLASIRARTAQPSIATSMTSYGKSRQYSIEAEGLN